MVLNFKFIVGIVFFIFILIIILPLFLINKSEKLNEKLKATWNKINRICNLIYILFLLIFVGYITYNSAEIIL